MADRDKQDRRSRREILSDPKAISDCRRNTADSSCHSNCADVGALGQCTPRQRAAVVLILPSVGVIRLFPYEVSATHRFESLNWQRFSAMPAPLLPCPHVIAEHS